MASKFVKECSNCAGTSVFLLLMLELGFVQVERYVVEEGVGKLIPIALRQCLVCVWSVFRLF